MKLRDLAISKRDILNFDPKIIRVEEGYNIRDLTTSDAQSKLMGLAQSIADNGFSIEQPITVRMVGEKVYVVAGHRRLAATLIAIEKLGAEIESIPCITEAKGTSEADRCADLVVSNSGEPLTALELGGVIKRLIAFGWENAKIAKKLGWASAQTVENKLLLLSAPEAVQEFVRNGDISATTAVETTRKHGAEAGEVIAKAKAQANSEGKTRVTKAHVSSTTGEFQPTAGHIKKMIAALQKIADGSDDDAADTARDCLESVGLMKPQKVAA